LLPCICILQPILVHLYQTSSPLPGPFLIVASISLRLFYSLLYSGHINHIQVLGFLPFLRASVLQCRHSPTWTTLPGLFCFLKREASSSILDKTHAHFCSLCAFRIQRALSR
jgi:hypothetical protein